ncbi:hypothetical protein P4V47_24750 [Brevibacillus laterosporus]|uniref:hypothetical protein n=1 Tax=Brevibacillus laterosporus TaxID=1465 RepID=UPI002E1AD526|nr:hypothetical protein [Brevibacillus laterosporus]
MKKVLLPFLFVMIFSFTSTVLAVEMYPYGPFLYGKKNVDFSGNLSKSGLTGIQQRKSIVNRHDMRFQNMISNQTGAYIHTVQHDIQEVLPTDDFRNKRGYHVVPLDEELVKDLATKANGDAQWVWQQVSKNLPHSYVEKYTVDRKYSYINIGAIAYLSGGGDPDMQQATGDGINSPLFKTTYKSTNWPSISVLEQNQDGSLKIIALAHSVYDTAITGTITINGQSKQLFSKNTDVANYTVTYDGSIPLSQLPGLIEGGNTVTLTVSDKFGRTATKTITIQTIGLPPATGEVSGVTMALSRPNASIDLSNPGAHFFSESLYYNGTEKLVIDSTTSSSITPMQQTVTKFPNTDDHWIYVLNAWTYDLKSDSGSITMTNTSKAPIRYVISQEMVTPINLKTHTVKTLSSGASTSLPSDGYVIFPTSLELSGYWANVPPEFGYGVMVKKDKLPSDPKTLAIIKSLVVASEMK